MNGVTEVVLSAISALLLLIAFTGLFLCLALLLNWIHPTVRAFDKARLFSARKVILVGYGILVFLLWLWMLTTVL